ncbi:tetratricopeptide repeat protein [Baaleninema sp.]|uniref:tetratricopeptide repeat protein n=1 Tax=Baaleninema sp. TaxID=3101197 RepID=UPI003CFECDC4
MRYQKLGFWLTLVTIIGGVVLEGTPMALGDTGLRENPQHFVSNLAQDAYDLGVELYEAEKYEEALQAFSEAIRHNERFVNAYLYRGLCHHNLGNHEEAIEDYSEAISLKNDYGLAYQNRGLSYQQLEDYEAAIADFTQAIRLNPDDVFSYRNRGRSHQNLENHEEAIDDFTQAIRLNPEDADFHYLRGQSYRALGEINQARNDFENAAELYQSQGNETWYQNSIDILNSLDTTQPVPGL